METHNAKAVGLDAAGGQSHTSDGFDIMTSAPQRVQLSRRKGWRMPANTVKVDRTTKWGNPFIVGEHGTRAECVRLFELLLGGYLCISANNADAQDAYMTMARRDREQLRGKNLACWCPLDAPCHADVLLMMSNVEFSGTPAALSPEAPLERRVGGAVPPAPTFADGMTAEDDRRFLELTNDLTHNV